jgi:hypothetical protein
MTYLARIPQNVATGFATGIRAIVESEPEQYRSGWSRGIVHRAGAGNRHEGER